MAGNNYLKAINIEWDVDHEDDLDSLPKEVLIPSGMEKLEEISEYLSDLTGFCHKRYELRREYRYQVKLCYGYEQNEAGAIFHAFEAIGPDESPVDMAIDKKLKEVLEADDDTFDWNWLFITLPDSIVSQIRSEVVDEFSLAQTVSKQEVAVCYDQNGKIEGKMTDERVNKCLAQLQDAGFSWEQAMTIMNIVLESHRSEDAVAEVANAIQPQYDED